MAPVQSELLRSPAEGRDLPLYTRAAGAAASIPPSPSALLTDLAAYWKLDEASGPRLDSVANNDAAVVGSPGSAAGILSNAVVTSSGNHLDAGNTADLQMGDYDFTFTMWVWLGSVPAQHDIFGKWASGDLEYFLFVPANTFKFFVGNLSTFNSVEATSFGALSANTWYFVACWYDATANTVNIQINDGVIDSNSHPDGGYAGSASLLLGASAFGGTLTGRMDEVGIWKRLLTPQERTDLYNAGAGLTYPF